MRVLWTGFFSVYCTLHSERRQTSLTCLVEVFLEFPHEKIARCSSTVRRSKEAHRNPLGSPGPGPGQLQPVTTSQSIISVAPPPALNPLNPRSGSMRYSSSQAGDTALRHRPGKQGSTREALSKKSSVASVTSVTSDINECGLPIPPPPPIPPDQPQPLLTTFSKNVKNKKQFPRSSIRRSIRKYHWTDVNNNNSSSRSDNESFLDPHQSLTPYNGETMKSSGESVYF